MTAHPDDLISSPPPICPKTSSWLHHWGLVCKSDAFFLDQTVQFLVLEFGHSCRQVWTVRSIFKNLKSSRVLDLHKRYLCRLRSSKEASYRRPFPTPYLSLSSSPLPPTQRGNSDRRRRRNSDKRSSRKAAVHTYPAEPEMGNCVFRGFAEVEAVIKVVTSSGGIMELYSPITAECITSEFPGHGIFRSRDLFSQPLLHNEELLVKELYYLLPLTSGGGGRITREGDIRPYGIPSSLVTPYRMSFDNQGILKRSETEIYPGFGNAGVWKVKLVISPEQLSEILSQDARTEALIESVRTVAKCGNGISSVANSDMWSLSSSRKASSEKNSLEF